MPTTWREIIPGLTDQRFTGTIKAFSRDMYFGDVRHGFIECEELELIFGMRVYIPSGINQALASTCSPGDPVSFGMVVGEQGKPVAVDVLLASSPTPLPSERKPTWTDLGHFSGRITFYDAMAGLGWIESAELQELFQKDALFRQPFPHIGIGDRVSFAAVLHEHGLLQACDLVGAAPLTSSGQGRRVVTVEHECGRSLADCFVRARHFLPECDAAESANLVWSVALLKGVPFPLFNAIAAASIARITSCRP